MKLAVWHAEQRDGTWVATCEQLPGWACFGASLAQTRSRAENSLIGAVEEADFEHFEVRALPEAA